MAFNSLCWSLFAATLVTAQSQQVQYGQVITINGDMNLNSLQFPDNAKIEAFSQTQKQLIVNQNPNPLSANHVVGSSGNPFVQLSQQSMRIQTNNASDLVGAQVEMPIDPNTIQQMGVTADNTFVARLSDDRQAWVVVEGIKSVNTTDNTVRMIKMNVLDGEYMAVGRQTTETSNVLTTFNNNQQVQITGDGIQETEFTDGFRMSIKASQPLTMKTDVTNGVSSSMTPGGIMSVNNFRYKVTSNLAGVQTSLNQMVAVIQMPLNAQRIMNMAQQMGAQANGAISLGVAQRVVLQNPGGSSTQNLNKRQDPAASSSTSSSSSSSSSTSSANTAATDTNNNQATQTQVQLPQATQLLLSPTFSPLTGQPILDMMNARIAVPANSIDGEFIVTMGMAGSQGTLDVTPGGQTGGQAGSQIGGQTSSQPSLQAGGQPSPQAGGERPTGTQTGAEPGLPGAEPSARPSRAAGQRPSSPNGQAPAEPAGATPSTGERPQEMGQTPAKRQAPTAPQGSIIMTMAQLGEMVQRQKTGGVIPVWSMMTEYVAQQGSAQASRPLGAREELKKGRRGVPLKV